MMKILAGIVGFITIILGMFFWHNMMVFVKAPDSMFFLFWTYIVSLAVMFILKVAADLED